MDKLFTFNPERICLIYEVRTKNAAHHTYCSPAIPHYTLRQPFFHDGNTLSHLFLAVLGFGILGLCWGLISIIDKDPEDYADDDGGCDDDFGDDGF